ncbi:MAG: hypothetical protein P8N43_07630, partial [Alphaproteobacteria bacterium]|nr:hypothetical protein [Alphaproteobacteria bacterium]
CDNPPSRSHAKESVGRVCYQKRDWIREGSPSQHQGQIYPERKPLDRVLHQLIGNQKDDTHKKNGNYSP